MSEATLELPTEDKILKKIDKLLAEERTKATDKPKANGETPIAKHKSPAVEKSSVEIPKIVTSDKTTNSTPKPAAVEKVTNPKPILPAEIKASKPRVKMTKKLKRILAKAKTGNRKGPKKNDRVNGATKDFVVRFFSKLTSLKDPHVKRVMRLLTKAVDVKVHRKFHVSCKSTAAAKKLISQLQRYNLHHVQKFHILPKSAPSVTPLTPRIESHMLYVVDLPKTTNDKDLQNSFNKAKSVHITQVWKQQKCIRIGHINFTSADDAKEALDIKNRRVNGKYVQVTADKSTAMKRPVKQIGPSSPAKRAKLVVDKKTPDEGDDHGTMQASDLEGKTENKESSDRDVSEDEEENMVSEDDEGGSRDDEEDDSVDEEEVDMIQEMSIQTDNYDESNKVEYKNVERNIKAEFEGADNDEGDD